MPFDETAHEEAAEKATPRSSALARSSVSCSAVSRRSALALIGGEIKDGSAAAFSVKDDQRVMASKTRRPVY
jgi:hypothetical protein